MDRARVKQARRRCAGIAAALLLLPVLGLAGCAGLGGSMRQVIAQSGGGKPSLEAFRVCWGHGCQENSVIALTASDWAPVRGAFAGVSSPAQEREAIRSAVAYLETVVGTKTGTATDKAGTFNGVGGLGGFGNKQLDCEDEMLNIGTYLALMEDDGLLRHHMLAARVDVVFFEAGLWPHMAASIAERESGRRWVVDGWFLDNGEKPFVVELERWKDGSWRADYGLGLVL